MLQVIGPDRICIRIFKHISAANISASQIFLWAFFYVNVYFLYIFFVLQRKGMQYFVHLLWLFITITFLFNIYLGV